MRTCVAGLVLLAGTALSRPEIQGVGKMSEPHATEAQEYREVRAREIVSRPGLIDGQRIALVDYIDGGRKAVETPELLTLALSTAASPPGVATLLGSLGKRLVPARLKGVFRQVRGGPAGVHTLEVHSLEIPPEPPYQRVTQQELTGHPEKYDRMRVEYTGVFRTSFEGSWLDGVWLAFNPYATAKGENRSMRRADGTRQTRVRVRGVMHTQGGGHGHLGGAAMLLRADEIEYLP